MKRRAFLTLLGATASSQLLVPLAVRAQQLVTTRRLGILIGTAEQSDPEGQARVTAFLKALQDLGWIPGRNVQMDIRWFVNEALLQAQAAELIGLTPDAMLVAGNVALGALLPLIKSVPTVFVQVSDPVGSGFIQSVARPEGNVTGFENFEPAMGGKWLGIMREIAPDVSRVVVLKAPGAVAHDAFVRAAQAVASSLGIELTPVVVHDRAEIERAITTFANTAPGGIVVLPHPVTTTHRVAIIELAARYRLPAVYPYRFFTQSGGLVSYGIDQVEQWPKAASYLDRILRGAKPSELPVQAPTKFELVVNLRTARAIGLDIPPAFPLRADEVIE
jgi:putative ABC transport system substrate-binding protein